jgi:hypothetical protein
LRSSEKVGLFCEKKTLEIPPLAKKKAPKVYTKSIGLTVWEFLWGGGLQKGIGGVPRLAIPLLGV